MFRDVPHLHYVSLPAGKPPPRKRKPRRQRRPPLFVNVLRKRHKPILERYLAEKHAPLPVPWEWVPYGPRHGYFYNRDTKERLDVDLSKLPFDIPDNMTIGKYLSLFGR